MEDGDAVDFHPFVLNSCGVRSSREPEFSVSTQAEKAPGVEDRSTEPVLPTRVCAAHRALSEVLSRGQRLVGYYSGS